MSKEATLESEEKEINLTNIEPELLSNKSYPNIHQFSRTTFAKFTNCSHCSRFLWGLVKQGLTCQKCGFVCHPDCLNEVKNLPCKEMEVDPETLKAILTPTSTPILSKENLEPKDGLIHQFVNGNLRSVAAPAIPNPTIATGEIQEVSEDEMLEDIDEHMASNLSVDKNTFNSKIMDKSKSQTVKHSKALSLGLRRYASSDFKSSTLTKAEPKPSSSKPTIDTIVRGVFQQAANHKKQLQNARNQPKLGLLTTTPQNFSKFITRITPMRLFYEQLLSIITWEYPSRTYLFLIMFCVICYQPLWLLLLPHIGVWYYLANGFIQTYRKQVTEENSNNTNKSDEDKESFASSTQVYAMNMQFVQNLMGTYTDFHSQAIEFWETYHDKLNVSTALLVSGFGFPISLLIVYFIPLNYLFMVLGCLALLSNHPYCLALFLTLSPLLVDELSSHLGKATKVFNTTEVKELDPGNETRAKVVQVFENQRWWAMLGWKDQLLATERYPWTDETGNTECQPIYKQKVEPGYHWVGTGWEIVRDWCDQIQPDSQGWIYYNNIWEGPSNSARIDSFTRRRLWRRTMMPNDPSKVPTPAEFASTVSADTNNLLNEPSSA